MKQPISNSKKREHLRFLSAPKRNTLQYDFKGNRMDHSIVLIMSTDRKKKIGSSLLLQSTTQIKSVIGLGERGSTKKTKNVTII